MFHNSGNNEYKNGRQTFYYIRNKQGERRSMTFAPMAQILNNAAMGENEP